MAELVSLLTLRADADAAVVAEDLRDALGPGALVAPVLPGGRNAGDILVRLSMADAPPTGSSDLAPNPNSTPNRSVRVGIERSREPVSRTPEAAASRYAVSTSSTATRSERGWDSWSKAIHLLTPAIALADGALFEPAASAGNPLASPIHRTALFHAFRYPDADRLARFEQETVAMPRRLPFIRGWTLGRVTQSWGSFPWDYVWEQGYDRLGDLTGRYMRHPCHWGQVDRWFDPEHPDWLIDPGLCHAFCRQAPDMEDAA